MKNNYFGSCLCERVKFEILGEFECFYLCHCKHCQKDTGSAHAANLFSSMAKLAWVSGADNVTTFNLPSTRHVKCFCKDCGSALPSVQMDGKLLVVPAGSLNGEVGIAPTAHLFLASKASWEDKIVGIKNFETYPE